MWLELQCISRYNANFNLIFMKMFHKNTFLITLQHFEAIYNDVFPYD